MFEAFDKALSLLPFNGHKTSIGSILLLVHELSGPAQALVGQVGAVVATVGIIHKLLKAAVK